LAGIFGEVAERLSTALLNSFNPDQLDQLLRYKLNKSRPRISMARNYDAIVFDIILASDAEGWLQDLVLAARQSRPGDAAIVAVAAEIGQGPVVTSALESIIRERAPMIDPVQWRQGLAHIEDRICRIEDSGAGGSGPLGSGFLVNFNMCMTSFHVIEKIVLDPARASDIVLRFDYTRDSSGKEIYPGTTFRLAADWLVESWAYSSAEKAGSLSGRPPARDELDIAVMRVEGSPGSRPIGVAEPGGEPRGWLNRLSTAPAVSGDDLLIFQHPQGQPLQLAFGTVIDTNANGTRMRHNVSTDHGSSGSPCFNLALELVAVHQAGDRPAGRPQLPTSNRCVPIAAVTELLRERRRDLALFQPVA
jgi:hypothetical protein